MHTSGAGIYYVIFILLIAMTGWMIWQQSRQQKNRRQLQSSISVGDKVVTVGGVVGTVNEVREAEITLTVADGVTVTFMKSAIGGKYQGGTTSTTVR